MGELEQEKEQAFLTSSLSDFFSCLTSSPIPPLFMFPHYWGLGGIFWAFYTVSKRKLRTK